jgi:hypothetical protein
MSAHAYNFILPLPLPLLPPLLLLPGVDFDAVGVERKRGVWLAPARAREILRERATRHHRLRRRHLS